MKLSMIVCFTLLLPLVGCGEAQQAYTAGTIEAKVGALDDDSGFERLTSLPKSHAESHSYETPQPNETTLVASTDGQVVSDTKSLQRKVIYNTSIGLIVDEYERFETDLSELVTRHGGFIARNETRRRFKNNQSGDWTIRMPVSKYNAFLTDVNKLGFAETRQENAEDVTEEYVDVAARISTKRALESRVLAILNDRSGKLSDVLEIERELSRVREEIERMEGRMRLLKERTSLATISIHCREQLAYEPAAAPTLMSRLRQALSSSLAVLRAALEGILVIAVTTLPWVFVSTIAVAILRRVTNSGTRGWLRRPRRTL